MGKLGGTAWLLSLFALGCSSTPLSVDLHYSADAPKIDRGDALAGARIGLARFADARARDRSDPHASSYVAHSREYDIGVTWHGRTFTHVATVVQGLLVDELAHAGLQAEPIDAELTASDVLAARAAGERAHLDVVVVGTIQRFAFREQERGADSPCVVVESALVEVAGGRVLQRSTLRDGSCGAVGLDPGARADDLFARSFKKISQQLVGEIGKQLTAMLADASEPHP